LAVYSESCFPVTMQW